MIKIDTNNATFNQFVMLRGYVCRRAGRVLFYGSSLPKNKIHIVIHDEDGFWEYEAYNQYATADRYVDILADDASN